MNARSFGSAALAGTLLLGAVLPPGSARGEDAGKGYWSVQIENDFFGDSKDRWYTNGFEVARLGGGEGPGWLRWLAGFDPLELDQGEESAVSWSVGQKIFTPEDKQATELVPGDRPYAGFTFVRLALLRGSPLAEVLRTGKRVEVTVGLVGPSSGAEQVQRGFHKLIGNSVPQGWDNQLHDEVTLGLSFSRFWSYVEPGAGSLQFGFNPHVTIELGTPSTFGAGGVMFRLGTNLKGDFNPPGISPGFPGISFFEGGPGSNWYFFFGHESRLVARDLFLDGNTFEKSPHVEKEELVGDYQYGFAFRTGDLRLSLSNMVRTKEFTTQRKQTRYGALTVSFTD